MAVENLPAKKPSQVATSNNDVGCTISEYDQNFKPGEAPNRGPFPRPPDLLKSSADLRKFETTTKTFHAPFEVAASTRGVLIKGRDRDNLHVECEQKMATDTEHHDHYVQLKGVSRAQMPAFRREKTQPFRVNTDEKHVGTVTASEYFNKTTTRVKPADPPKPSLRVPTDPFGGTSAFKGDFVDFHKRRDSIRRQTSCLSFSKDKFGGKTSNNHDFVAHKQLPAIVKKKDPYVPNNLPFGAESRTKLDFTKPPAVIPPVLASWNNHLFETDDRIADTTTASEEFVRRDLPPRVKKKKEVYVPSEGKMDSVPISHDWKNFSGDAHPSKCARPVTTIRLGSSTFHSDTHSKEVHRQFQIEPVTDQSDKRDPRKATLTIKTGADTNYVSESKGNYHPLTERPSNTGRVPDSLFPAHGPFASVTSYNEQFSPRRPLQCES